MSYKHKIALTSQYMMSSNPKIIAKNSSTQGTLGSNPKKHLNHTIQFLNKKNNRDDMSQGAYRTSHKI